LSALETEHPTLGISLGGGWPLGTPEPRQIIQFARLIDELGFAALWTGDHVLMYSPMVHALVTLSAAAAVTERVAIGTGVYLLGLRHPVEAGKALASLDWLSNGRFIFGVGVGGEIAAEWAACGVPRSQRGARVDEGLQVLKALWAGPHANHTGRFWQFEDVSIQPLPMQAGGPPVVVGGRSEAAWRRAARYDGWMGYLLTPERLAQGIAAIDAQREAAGRTGPFLRSHLLFGYIATLPRYFARSCTLPSSVLRTSGCACRTRRRRSPPSSRPFDSSALRFVPIRPSSKHVLVPVWHAAPFWSTSTSRVSPSQSRRTSTTRWVLPDVAPFTQYSCLDRE